MQDGTFNKTWSVLLIARHLATFISRKNWVLSRVEGVVLLKVSTKKP